MRIRGVQEQFMTLCYGILESFNQFLAVNLRKKQENLCLRPSWPLGKRFNSFKIDWRPQIVSKKGGVGSRPQKLSLLQLAGTPILEIMSVFDQSKGNAREN